MRGGRCDLRDRGGGMEDGGRACDRSMWDPIGEGQHAKLQSEEVLSCQPALARTVHWMCTAAHC